MSMTVPTELRVTVPGSVEAPSATSPRAGTAAVATAARPRQAARALPGRRIR